MIYNMIDWEHADLAVIRFFKHVDDMKMDIDILAEYGFFIEDYTINEFLKWINESGMDPDPNEDHCFSVKIYSNVQDKLIYDDDLHLTNTYYYDGKEWNELKYVKVEI